MSMRFTYQLRRSRQPAIALGGRLFRPRPLVMTSITGPKDTFADLALLDTGSDDSVFHDRVARRIGLDLSNAPTGMAGGVGGGPVQVRFAQVALRLTDGSEFREWTAWIGFTPVPLVQPLLGYAGCLQYFHANFLGDQEAVELTVNTLYPGS